MRSRRRPDHSHHDEWMGPLPASPGCDCQICRPEPAYDATDRSTIDGVLRHGWQVLLVSDEVGCEAHEESHEACAGSVEPAFGYSVGLGHRAGHPELLISGLDPRVMHVAVNVVAERVLAGERFRAGDVLEGVLGGWPVVLERASDLALVEATTWSGWFHRRPPEALVIVWPGSRDGLFPWQPGAAAAVGDAQPERWREAFDHTGAAASDPPWTLPVPADQRVFTCSHVVEDREPVRWASREPDPDRGEDWCFYCSGSDHDVADLRVVHVGPLTRRSPTIRELGDLALDEMAERRSAAAEWVRAPLQ